MKRELKKTAALLFALSITISAAGCTKDPVSPESSSSLAESSAAPVSSAPMTSADYDYSAGLTEDGYFEGIKALDYVSLPDYEELPIPASVTDVTDSAVQQKVDQVLAGVPGESGTPELTDEFVAEKLKETYGWSTVGEMRAALRNELVREGARNYLWEQVQQNSQVKEVPEAIKEYYTNNMRKYYLDLAEKSGQELEDFLSQQFSVGSMEELEKSNQEILESNAKTGLILQALCEEMDIHPTEEDIKEYFEKNVNAAAYEDYKERYGSPYLHLMVRENTAKEWLDKDTRASAQTSSEPQQSEAESEVESGAESEESAE